jgi:hypothetical protein
MEKGRNDSGHQMDRRVEKISDLKSYPDWLSLGYWTSEFIKEPGMKMQDGSHFQHTSFFSNERDRILTYDPNQTRHILVPFLSSDMSVCYSWHMWAVHLGYVMYSVLGMIFLAEIWYPDTYMGTEEQPIGACPSSKPLVNVNMCKFEDILHQAKTEFRFLIAFILAGYVGSSVATWKERRTDYASLCGNTRNLMLNIGTLVPETSKICEDPRATCSRWGLLAYELAVLKSRGHMDSLQGKQYLEEYGVLLPGEWELLANGDRHSAALYWCQTLINKMNLNGEMTDNSAIKVCEDISSFRAKANDMMSSLNRDLPFPYVALCGMLVKVNVFIMSSWKAVQWSAWLKTFGYGGLSNQIRFWAEIFLLFAWNVSYMALYDLGYFLDNPFGNRRIDVAHEIIGLGLHKLGAYCSTKRGNELPYPLNEVTGHGKKNRK